MKSRRVAIFGAGRHGRVVQEILEDQGHEVIGWFDDNISMHGTVHCGAPVFGGLDALQEANAEEVALILGMGNPAARRRIATRIKSMGYSMVNAIHPSATVLRSVRLGTGVCVCAGAIVSTGAQIGDNVVLNTGVQVDHDTVIEEGVWISGGAHIGGCVNIGKDAFVGMGATIISSVSVGTGSVLGAGALASKNIPSGVLALGVPARVVKPIDEQFNWKRLLSGEIA